MNEWFSALLVFWALWAADGVRLVPAAVFAIVGTRRRATLHLSRWLFPGWWPASWRASAADLPFALSPAGICNRPVGVASRPGEAPWRAQAWAWADIRDVSARDGWLWINGTPFCRDTGHLPAKRLLALAQLDAAARAEKISWLLHRWLRPAHLRRRARALAGRTALIATLNAWFFGLAAVLSLYLAGDGAGRLPTRWAEAVARGLPWLALYLFLLHAVAVGAAWRALRKLPAVAVDKRSVALLSATLLPPQALRLRALLGEAFFPTQHPLAYALAFARKKDLAALAFQTLGDLRWPLGGAEDPPLAQEIARWFGAELGERLRTHMRAAGVEEAALFAAPVADAPGSCSYCPRCRSQFVTAQTHCPHGVALQPVARR
ncbi:MAG: hypothetical protein HZA31_11030 [Opitutae bacterium]|nr:hypothetical protein [Opitutae bacterium]